MENVSRHQFEQLIEGATVLADSHRGPHVYLTPDNKVVKMFRQKRLLTTNRLYPYARRFERNAKRLKLLGFNSVTVEKVARCRDLNKHLVIYPLLPGITIRELADRPDDQKNALNRLPDYLCELHQKGVFYKAFHLGNVLVQEDGSFALIDIHWTKFSRNPISVDSRLRNFYNTLGYAEDHESLTRYGLKRFFDAYLACCQLGTRRKMKLLSKLRNSQSFPELELALSNL